MVDREDKRFFDFMCSCGDEGKSRCEEVYEDVKSSLETTDKGFLNSVVYGLQNMKNGQAEIIGIPSDMWSAVSIEYMYDFKGYDLDNCEACNQEEDPTSCEHGHKIQRFWIECDQIHHGLARAYQLVKEFDER